MKNTKKILALCLCAMMAFSMFGCGKNDKGGASGDKKGGAIDLKKEVEITIPQELVAMRFEYELTDESLETFAKNEEFNSAKLNDDGTVTLKMTGEVQQEFIAEILGELDTAINSVTQGDDKVESYTNISYNEDMTEFTVLVNGEVFTKFDTMYALGIFAQAGMYAVANGTDPGNIEISVKYIDDKTNDELAEVTYNELMLGNAISL